MSKNLLSSKTVFFKGVAGGSSPKNLLKQAHIKENKNKGQGNMISIEKRMPINIFNIKNVNYLNTEPHDTSQSIFKNETIKEKKIYDDLSLYQKQRRGRKDKRSRPKSFSKTFGQHDLHNDYQIEHSKSRKKSLDSKYLVEMMTKVNLLKAKPEGAKILFQKIVRNFEKNEDETDYSGIRVLMNYLHSIKRKFNHTKIDRSRSNDKSVGKKTHKSDHSDMAACNITFATKTKKLAKELTGLIQEFKIQRSQNSFKKENFKNKETQTEPNIPNPISLTNLNIPALIKEFSRAFMLTKKIVNNQNETGSNYMRRLQTVQCFKDEQTAAIFKDIFSLEQEHVLVEESLRMIQDKGYDLEALFSEGYNILGINGNSNKLPTQRTHDSVEIENASSVTFESQYLSEDQKGSGKAFFQRDTNCFFLDFDRLDKSE